MRILLVDDDKVDRKVIIRALKKSGLSAEVEEAVDAQSALALLKESMFDCLLLDYRLPDLDGISVAQDIFSNSDGPAIPVVMLTGEGNESVAVEAMKSGIQDYLPKSNLGSENLARAIRSAVDRAISLRQTEEMNKTFEHMALNDSLTGLGNRNLFNSRLDSQIATAKRNQEAFALLIMDLDRFKEINDTYGHEAGDESLREAGKRLKALSRDADAFFRLGGDEFSALITTGVTQKGIEVLSQKIISAFQAPITYQSASFTIGISIGIAFYPEHSLDRSELLQLADAAMYKAKRNKNGYFFEPVCE